MINALDELNEILEQHQLTYYDIICAKVDKFILKENHYDSELEYFLQELNTINYENVTGDIALQGRIWLTKNRWLEREIYFYDYWNEYWELKELPEIPQELKHDQCAS